ncbi:MAG: hypothetical protein R3Y11_08450 [Pseudomonadota bacterium]
MNKITITFGYDGDIDEASLEEIFDMVMSVQGRNVSPVELLYAGCTFHRYAVERFTEDALAEGRSKEECDGLINAMSDAVNELDFDEIKERLA